MTESSSTRAEALSLVNDISKLSPLWTIVQATKLRNALRVNGMFSLVSGTAMVSGGGWLVSSLGLSRDSTWLVQGIGVGLLAFAAYLFFESAAPLKRLLSSSLYISIADGMWVLGSVALVLWGVLSPVGAIIVGAVAVVIASFAGLQLHARRRARTASVENALWTESPPTEAVLFARNLEATAARLWPIITDHELYGRLAANLGGATAVTPNGPGLIRECSSASGRSWSETCTLWDAGRRFAVNVETDSPDYPYALQLMQGTWGVESSATPSSSVVTMAFAFRPSPGLKGWIMAIVMNLSFGRIFRRIVAGWKRASL